MGRRRWSGRDLVIMANKTVPLTGLSDEDDAVTVEDVNDLFAEAQRDLTGQNGVHVEDATGGIIITLKFKIGATAAITFLDNVKKLRQPLSSLTGRNAGSATSSFWGKDVALKSRGQWGGGKNPISPVFTFEAIEGDFQHGGQLVT